MSCPRYMMTSEGVCSNARTKFEQAKQPTAALRDHPSVQILSSLREVRSISEPPLVQFAVEMPSNQVSRFTSAIEWFAVRLDAPCFPKTLHEAQPFSKPAN